MATKNMTLTVPAAATASNGSTISAAGVSLISSGSPLTRLNYFDGKFIRATDMQAEQAYFRNLVEFSNQAGGPGVANGFSVSLNASGQVVLSPGMAIDPKGRLLLLSAGQTLNLSDLLAAPVTSSIVSGSSAFGDCPQTSGGSTLLQPAGLYLLTICHTETLCGQEDVYGNLCQEACVTSTDRPYIVEGIVVRLVPLTLNTALPASNAIALGAHLRSRVASSFFADERLIIPDLISGACVASDIWCMGANGASGCCVSLGVVGTSSSAISFLDAWTARRERIDPPAKRYWQWRMKMRPWDVYLAQILQFQCQLQDGLGSMPSGPDPCTGAKTMVTEAATVLKEFQRYYKSVSDRLASSSNIAIPKHLEPDSKYLTDLMSRLSAAENAYVQQATTRLLINQGIVELPSAGYLPVTPGSTATINAQVEQWMGEGVNLHYCVISPDYAAQALEEAQHLERISLIAGIDDPTKKPDVDILVPGGTVMPCSAPDLDLLQARISVGDFSNISIPTQMAEHPMAAEFSRFATTMGDLEISGTARATVLDSGGGAFYIAVEEEPVSANRKRISPAAAPAASTSTPAPEEANPTEPNTAAEADAVPLTDAFANLDPASSNFQAWAELKSPENLLSPTAGGSSLVGMRLIVGLVTAKLTAALDVGLQGTFVRTAYQTHPNAAGVAITVIRGTFDAVLTAKVVVKGGQTVQPAPTQHQWDVQFELSQANAGRKVVLTLAQPNSTNAFTFKGQWLDTSPLKITFQIDVQAPTTANGVVEKVEFLKGTLLQSADVAQAGNAYHQRAIDALETIAADLSTPAFPAAAETDLYPQVTPVDSPDVIGNACWVLFKRRPEKQCATCDTVAVPATVNLHYRVYESQIAFAAYGAPTGPIEIGVVEFGSDLTSLTSSSDLLNQWSMSKVGNTIIEGKIYSASQDAIEKQSTALNRLQSVENALSATTPLRRPINNRVEHSLPATGFDFSAVDGIILIITEDTQAQDKASAKRSKAKEPA